MSAAREVIEAHLRAYSAFLETQPADSLAEVSALFAEENRSGAVVLPRDTGLTWEYQDLATHRVVVGRRADFYAAIRLQIPSVTEEHCPPGVWYGAELRSDEDGRRWERSLRAVCDDFGNLVEVSP